MDKPHILLVDDDPTLLMIGEAELSSLGYPVATVENGMEALAYLAQNPCDLVVTDYEMPDCSGLDLLDGIRSSIDPQLADMPVIMVTGRNDDNAVNAAFEAGATTFLQKPINWLNLEQHLSFVIRTHGAKRDIAAARDQAEASAKAQSSLMMVLRHELKTPLHQIMGYASFLTQDHGMSAEETAEQMEHLHDAAQDLNNRLSKTFRYSELQNTESVADTQNVILDDVISSTLIQISDMLEAAQVEFTKEYDQSLEILADPYTLGAALTEVFTNAISVSLEGGTVSVNAGENKQGDFVLVVSDNGPGFPSEERESLLQAFAQKDSGLRRISEGLGLGLAIVHEVMKKHGGTIRLEDAESGGGRVVLIFPGKKANAVAA